MYIALTFEFLPMYSLIALHFSFILFFNIGIFNLCIQDQPWLTIIYCMSSLVHRTMRFVCAKFQVQDLGQVHSNHWICEIVLLKGWEIGNQCVLQVINWLAKDSSISKRRIKKDYKYSHLCMCYLMLPWWVVASVGSHPMKYQMSVLRFVHVKQLVTIIFRNYEYLYLHHPISKTSSNNINAVPRNISWRWGCRIYILPADKNWRGPYDWRIFVCKRRFHV